MVVEFPCKNIKTEFYCVRLKKKVVVLVCVSMCETVGIQSVEVKY